MVLHVVVTKPAVIEFAALSALDVAASDVVFASNRSPGLVFYKDLLTQRQLCPRRSEVQLMKGNQTLVVCFLRVVELQRHVVIDFTHFAFQIGLALFGHYLVRKLFQYALPGLLALVHRSRRHSEYLRNDYSVPVLFVNV